MNTDKRSLFLLPLLFINILPDKKKSVIAKQIAGISQITIFSPSSSKPINASNIMTEIKTRIITATNDAIDTIMFLFIAFSSIQLNCLSASDRFSRNQRQIRW